MRRHSRSGAEHCECFLLAAVNIRPINPRGEESFEVANIFYIKNRKHSTSKLINLLAGCVRARAALGCRKQRRSNSKSKSKRERERDEQTSRYRGRRVNNNLFFPPASAFSARVFEKESARDGNLYYISGQLKLET